MRHTEIVSSYDQLCAIGPAWDRLWHRCSASVFQSHGWLTAWLSAQDVRMNLRIAIGTCWEDGELRAVIACATRVHRGVRVLEWAGKECSDYSDALAAADDHASVHVAWLAMMQHGGFDAIHLSHVRPGAIMSEFLQMRLDGAAHIRAGRRSQRSLQVQSNGLTGREWFSALSKKARNNHTRGKRILAELGAVSIGVLDDAEVDTALERMIELKQRWLQATGQSNPLLAEPSCGLRRLVGYLKERQALQLFRIECQGELVAGLVNINCNGSLAAFFSAFDPRFERASPGTILIVEHILWAFKNDFAAVDFLCGEEVYKTRYANARTELSGFVGARTLVGHGAILADKVVSETRGLARQLLRYRQAEIVGAE